MTERFFNTNFFFASDPSVIIKEKEKPLEKWEDQYVKLPIESYQNFKHLFKKGKMTKKHVFEKIAERFNATADVTVNAEQCLRKWGKLEQKFKEVEDNNNRTGKGRKEWKFSDEMSACLGESPKVNPAFTFDLSSESEASGRSVSPSLTQAYDRFVSLPLSQASGRSVSPSLTQAHGRSASTSASSTDNGDGTDDEDSANVNSNANEKRKNLKARGQRKRKSYSSAAEMLSFLQTYTEKREKAEEEKLNLLREIKDERKEQFGDFLDILRNKK